jgi:ppGpp synthetase/RelA/SpoT-type nucleotidyltranferase
MDESTLPHEYGQDLPAWQDLARRLQTLLVEQLADLKPTNLYRIETLDSALEKMRRRSSQSFDDVVDWVGLRVMVPSPRDLPGALERLRTIFDVEDSDATTTFAHIVSV